jgi:RNA polymerase sigma-70 factor (ECF subfamily)
MTAESVVTTIAREEKGGDRQTADPILLAAIRAVKAGDSRAFEQIMIATERRVAVLAWRILGNPEEVKDAVQETFLRVFRHLHRYDERRDFLGWLFRISVNVCRDLERHRRKRAHFFTSLEEAESVSSGHDPDDAIGRKQDAALLTRAVDTLPPKERLALILRDVEELSTEEVARILGNRAATVRVQVSSARLKIRKLIETWLGGKRS